MTDHTVFGKLVDKEGVRDAIHVAAISVRAGGRLKPGDKVYRDDDGSYVKAEKDTAALGIVDPFMNVLIHQGDIFWLFLRPGTITGLRHVWEHPDFPSTVEVEVNEETDEDYKLVLELSDMMGYSYERLMKNFGAFYRWDIYEYDNSETYKDIDDKYWNALERHYIKMNPDVEPISGRWGNIPYTCAC